MKKSQLNAISYYYAEQNRKKAREQAAELRIEHIFEFQKNYKTITRFVKAYGTERFLQAAKSAKKSLEKTAETPKKAVALQQASEYIARFEKNK